MELWENGPQFEQSKHFRPGTDSVLLADFVNIGTRRRGIDLGCGSGILPLLLLVRSERLHMTGLEINSEAARVARENMAANALETRCDIISGDIRRCRELFKTGQFDLVVPIRRTLPPEAAGRAQTRTRPPHAAKSCARWRIYARGDLICAERAARSALCTEQSVWPTSYACCAKRALRQSACARCRTRPEKSRRSCSSRGGAARTRA